MFCAMLWLLFFITYPKQLWAASSRCQVEVLLLLPEIDKDNNSKERDWESERERQGKETAQYTIFNNNKNPNLRPQKPDKIERIKEQDKFLFLPWWNDNAQWVKSAAKIFGTTNWKELDIPSTERERATTHRQFHDPTTFYQSQTPISFFFLVI